MMRRYCHCRIQIDHIRDETGGEEREDSEKGGGGLQWERNCGGSSQKVETMVLIRW